MRRRAAALPGLALLAAAALMPGLARTAGAQTVPNPQNPSTLNAAATLVATPWSWPQFKQSGGTINAADTYYATNPGLPTILQDSPLGETTPADTGTELRGFVLGDYSALFGGDLTPPQPTDDGFNTYNFYETSGTNNIYTDGKSGAGATGWVSPLYSLSTGRDQCIQTVDSSGATTGTTGTATNGGFAQVSNDLDIGQVGTTYYEAAVGAAATYTWTLTAPTAGYYTIYADIPNDTVYTRTTAASYTVQNTTTGAAALTISVDQSTHGYVLVGGITTTGSNQTITVTLSAANSTGTGVDVLADALQLREPRTTSVDNLDTEASTADFQFVNGTNAWVVDTTAGDQSGADYLASTAITRGGASTQTDAYWLFNVPTTGTYSMSVYYPVQYQEYFTVDAEYTLKVYSLSETALTSLPATDVAAYLANNTVGTDDLAYTQTVTLDQTIDGGAYRRVFGATSIPAGDTAVLQLDNTSASPNYQGEPRLVIADSAELSPDDGTVYGTVVATNTTNDNPELAAGEGNTSATAPGGLGAVYQAPAVDSASGSVGGATQTYGVYGTTNGVSNVNNVPIGQVAYFGRAENVPYNGVNGANFTPGAAQQNGAVYAVDGLTGSIIWRFGANDQIIDDSSTTEFNPGADFSATEVTAPDTDFYGGGYRTATALATGTGSPAVWTLPATAQTQGYDVYVWFPSATATEPHIQDAAYSVADLVGTYSRTLSVSQLSGGRWIQLQSTRANGSFDLGAGSTVSLSDVAYSGDITGYDAQGNKIPAATAQADVVADAALFVPVNSPGPVMSTPLLVRNMKVIGADGNYYKRDCLIVTDNLGKMYCLDAAGNGDADNTLEDADGNPVALDAAGYPAYAPNVTPSGTNSFAFQNGATTGITLPTPYNLHVADYGTTTVYWVWQPNAAPGSVVLHTKVPADTADSTETAPDGNRDLPAPDPFFTNSPTAALFYDTTGGNDWYEATIFVGNPNGTLYSLNGQGEPANPIPANNAQPVDSAVTNFPTGGNYAPVTELHQYRISQDPTVFTPDVNWWFNTGESIASAPAYDPAPVTVGGAATPDGHVYVTTYNSGFLNIGHLYSVDAVNGGIGNVGTGYSTPGTYNYNVTPLSFWSFPDKYGAVTGFGTNKVTSSTIHVFNSALGDPPGSLPALPLGDIAGSPTVENIDSRVSNGNGGFQAHILIAANDPGAPTNPGTTNYGRVYMVDEAGNQQWAYPATGGGGANSVSTDDTNAWSTVYAQPTYFNGDTADENDFATSIIADDPNQDPLFVASSPVCGIIQFPTTALSGLGLGALSSAANSTLLTNAAVPMAYVGTLGGHLLALDLNGGLAETNNTSLVNDPGGHLVSDTIVGDQAAIYSTPALLPGSSGVAKNVGGTVYVNAADPAMYELEALPATTDANSLPVEPQYFTYGTLGGVSSPSLTAFNSAAYNDKVTVVTGEDAAGDTTSTTEAASGDIEFLYSGSDGGYAYGLTPNTTSTFPGGGGTGFVPGFLIPSGNLPPPSSNTGVANKYLVVRLSSQPNNYNYNTNSYGSDVAALYDWGQRAYVQVFGVYQPGAATGSTTAVAPPYSLWVSYTLSGGGRQSGGSQTVQIDSTNTQLAVGLPTTLTAATGGLFDANQTYVTTFPVNIGEGTAFLPGTRRSLRNLTLTFIAADGTQQTIRLNQGSATRYRTSAGGSTRPIPTPLPATMTILNPIAVTGGGKTLDGNPANYPNMGELGPVSGVTTQFYALPSSVNGGTTANGLPLISAQPDVQEAMVNGNPVVDGTAALVAVGLGDITHNTAGDSTTTYGGDPTAYSKLTSDPHKNQIVDASYGSSLLLLADRSALGTIGGSINNVYLNNDNDAQLSWNDNSGQEGPGSVINNLSWDTTPVDQHQNPTNNPSSDYPNLPAKNLSATLVARTTIYNTANNVGAGVSASLTTSPGTLAPSDAGSGLGDPTGTRTVFPMATIVKLAVPKYQPANLEVFQPTTTGSSTATPFGGNEIQHANISTNSPGSYVPEGYIARSRVFTDLSGNSEHRFNPNTAAYRDVSIYVGVPVDMGMSIDEPTVDLGTVTAGFGDQVSQNIGGTQTPLPWWPYDRKAKSHYDDPTGLAQSDEYFRQYFQPITVRDNGNVNLLNVHVDSDIVMDGAATVAQQSYVRLTSDQDETPYTSTLAFPPSQWTDSTAFIPSIDPSGLLFNNNQDPAVTETSTLLRSSLDPDVYVPNAQEADLNGQVGASHSAYPNATLHKARPGDPESSILSIPDEPHDSGNPAYLSLTKPTNSSEANVPYFGKPVVGIAVPLGTPAGTYSGTIRTYEGSDPYKAGTNYVSSVYTGPQYKLALNNLKAGADNSMNGGPTALYINNGTGVPEQYYSNPGTTLKIGVRESRFTDGPPLVGAATPINGSATAYAPFMALPSGDTAPAASVPTGTGGAAGQPLPTTDVQPFVFAVPGSGDANLYKMGLLFVSNRDAVANAQAGTANTFDLYSSAIAAGSVSGSALSAPSGPGSATWWTTPHDQSALAEPTTVSSTLASQISSPFVLSVGPGASQSGAFFVLRNVAAAASVNNTSTAPTSAPVYTLYEAALSSGTGSASSSNGLPIDMADAVALYSSSDPIYAVHAAEMPDTNGTERIVILWQARVRGHSRVEYLTASGMAAGSVLLATSNLDVKAPRELPVSASLVDVQGPSPVIRDIDSKPGDYTNTAPAANANAIATPGNANALDVTYSGTLQDGTTDLYVSRYALNATTSPVSLTRLAIVPQISATSAFSPTTLTLTRSGADTGLYYARDVDWAANLAAISISAVGVSSGTSLTVSGTITNGTGVSSPRTYTFDKASGQIVYPGVQLPWQTTGILGTVYVNPGLGTVRFSTPPTDPTTIVTASVVPLSARITYNSRTNTEPVSFIDDTQEPTITTNGTSHVNVSREWFIYRKSGSATGATAATNDTLYYDTRRLTVVLPSMSIETNNGNLASFDVKINTTSAGGGTDVTNLVDVDPARARVYFPSNMEGLYASISYKDQTGATQTVTGQQIVWGDEPYVNAQSPSAAAVGEHVLPVAAASNESNPSAFLDPTSGYTSAGTFVPHRIWVFWSSARNAAPQDYTGAGTGTGSTGSDLYYECIDPKFTPDLP